MAIPRWPRRLGLDRRALLATLLACGMIGLPAPSRAQDAAPPPDPTPVDANAAPGNAPPDQGAQADASGGQVLTQGPVHEAFATPVVHDPKASPTVAKQPPDPIQEMPPDQKPSGQNVQWIPGYWGWDATRSDYVWVSGVWREPPPGTQWVPGYWHNVDGGFQWVPGSWMPAAAPASGGGGQPSPQSQATYLPPPPATLETGPNSPQPAQNTVWNPGVWTWQNGGYAWRPGFWMAVQPNWVWMPAHYAWTPSGYLFVPGYWDLPVANRGLMFAPVYYPQPVYAQAGFSFTPGVAITASAMTSNLFVSVGTGQYMFGNYYAQANIGIGIVPWFQFNIGVGRPAFFDPLFSYYAVVNIRQNPMWIAQMRQAYILRRDNIALRPPGTYAEQLRVMRNLTLARDVAIMDHRNMAASLHELAARNVRLEHVAEAERRQIVRQAAELHRVRQQRAQLEREVARAGPADRPRSASLPHSPVASHPAARPAGHPGGHPAAHPGGEGARASMARRESEGRANEGRAAGTRAGARQPARAAARGRGRPAEESERERRPNR